jgi:hypothetical protein
MILFINVTYPMPVCNSDTRYRNVIPVCTETPPNGIHFFFRIGERETVRIL